MTHALTDSVTMFRRQLRHLQRYPSITAFAIATPLVFLLLFVYVFGSTLGSGIGGDRGDYVNYLVPGILMFTLAGAGITTSISVATDMTEGITDRFRSMAISRAAMLTGHVLGTLAQVTLALIVVMGVSLVIGFRPDATPPEWLALLGLLAGTAFALTWLSVGFGLVSKTVETASNLPMFLVLLPLFGSGFVPTDSMPTALRWFADYQPFTPITETMRGLLLGTEIGGNGVLAAVWCAVIGFGGYAWSRFLYDRRARS